MDQVHVSKIINNPLYESNETGFLILIIGSLFVVDSSQKLLLNLSVF